MPHLCSDCQKILCSVDQFFTNGPFDESFSETGQFAGEVQGWTKAAIEGTCDLCVMMYVDHDLEKARGITHEIASEGEMIWSFRWYIGDWVKLWFKSKSAFLGNAAYLQRQTMADSDGKYAPTSLAELNLTDQRCGYSAPDENVGWRGGRLNMGSEGCKGNTQLARRMRFIPR